MKGKEKCRILKQIRQQIAAENDIELVIRECTHKGDCRGTCPRCESEVRYLEEQLEKRRRLGKAVVVTALSAGLVVAAAGCTDAFTPNNVIEGDLQWSDEIQNTDGATAEPCPTQPPQEKAPPVKGEIEAEEEAIELEGDIAVEEEEEAELMGEPAWEEPAEEGN